MSDLWNKDLKGVNNFILTFNYSLNSQDWEAPTTIDNGNLTQEDIKEMLLDDLKEQISNMELSELINYCTFEEVK